MTLIMEAHVTTDVAYEDTFARCWADVFRFALAWTNDWAAAEDLTQDAFLRLWRVRTGVDWSMPLTPWLVTTTRRLSMEQVAWFLAGRSNQQGEWPLESMTMGQAR